MKKYLIGFVWVLVVGVVSPYHAEAWDPSFTEADKINDCKYGRVEIKNDEGKIDAIERGMWINTSLSLAVEKRCLQSRNKKLKVAGACDGLTFDTTRAGEDGKGLSLKIENGRYVVAEESQSEIECDEVTRKCSLSENYKMKVECFESSDFKKSLSKSTEPDKIGVSYCIVSDPPQMSGIDYPRENFPQFYCPKPSRSGYPDGKNPYDPENAYVKGALSEVYKYGMEEDELIRNCSLRMFALGKSCLEVSQKNSKKHGDILAIKSNFLLKSMSVSWRGIFDGAVLKKDKDGKVIKDDAKTYWNYVKDFRLRDLCSKVGNVECDDSAYRDIKDNKLKKEAFEKVKEWLSLKDFKNDSITLREHIKKKASDAWNDETDSQLSVVDVAEVLNNEFSPIYKEGVLEKLGWDTGNSAKKKFSELVKSAAEGKSSSENVAKYVSRRNMDLNTSVSIGQTSHIDVTSILRVSSSSKESKLSAFKSDEDHINIFNKIIRLAVRTMGTLAVLLLIISGVLMVISQGDENGLAKAKTTFTYTLLGLIVGFLSYTIVRFIIDILLS